MPTHPLDLAKYYRGLVEDLKAGRKTFQAAIAQVSEEAKSLEANNANLADLNLVVVTDMDYFSLSLYFKTGLAINIQAIRNKIWYSEGKFWTQSRLPDSVLSNFKAPTTVFAGGSPTQMTSGTGGQPVAPAVAGPAVAGPAPGASRTTASGLPGASGKPVVTVSPTTTSSGKPTVTVSPAGVTNGKPTVTVSPSAGQAPAPAGGMATSGAIPGAPTVPVPVVTVIPAGSPAPTPAPAPAPVPSVPVVGSDQTAVVAIPDVLAWIQQDNQAMAASLAMKAGPAPVPATQPKAASPTASPNQSPVRGRSRSPPGMRVVPSKYLPTPEYVLGAGAIPTPALNLSRGCGCGK